MDRQRAIDVERRQQEDMWRFINETQKQMNDGWKRYSFKA